MILPKPARKTTDLRLSTLLLSPVRFENDQEQFFFKNFQVTTAGLLGGSFENDLWKTLIMQACESSPSIVHAVIAMSALSFKPPLQHATKSIHERRAFAFREYSKAISLHRQSTAEGKAALRTNLITCLVFVNFEIMAGFLDSATSLAYSGVKLLDTFLASPEPENKTSIASPRPLQVEDELVQAFGRLELHAMGFADNMSPEEHHTQCRLGQVSINEMPAYFDSPKIAMIYLELILRRGMHLIKSYQRGGLQNAKILLHKDLELNLDDGNFLREKHEMMGDFERWDDAFQGLWKGTQDRQTRMAIVGIRLHKVSAWLHCILCGAGEEEYLGRNDAECQEIVDLCRYVIAQDLDNGIVIWDIIIIIPLMCVGMSFRNRRLRREAADLLLSTSRREGVWDAKVMGTTMRWLSDLEEEGLNKQSRYVDESRLVKKLEVVHNAEKRETMVSCYQPKGPGATKTRRRELCVRWDEANNET